MTVQGSGFRVLGSGSRFMVLALSALCCSALWLCCAQSPQAQEPARSRFDSARAYEHLRTDRKHRAAARGISGHRADARVHHRAAQNARHSCYAAGIRREDTHRRHSDGQPHRHHPGRAKRADRHHGTLRYEAVSRLPLRRCERRRVQHRISHRARTRAEGAHERVHDRADLLRRRRSHTEGLELEPITRMAASITWTPRARRGRCRR